MIEVSLIAFAFLGAPVNRVGQAADNRRAARR